MNRSELIREIGVAIAELKKEREELERKLEKGGNRSELRQQIREIGVAIAELEKEREEKKKDKKSWW